jgi:hypothetical protein
MLNRSVRFALLVPLVVVAGCGGHKTAEVTGTVTYDGKPLQSGTIILETSGARPAVGKIVDGQIVEVTTYKPGDGAPLGEHKVAIQSVAAASSAETKNPGDKISTDYMTAKPLIPPIYGDPATSGLTATISSGKNELKFDLKKKP